MRFELKVALRYLTSNRAQSALLIGGVALAVTVFTFNAALINGLAEFQIQRVVGSSAHVVVEPAQPRPAVAPAPDGVERIVAMQRSLDRRAQIKQWRSVQAAIEGLPGIAGLSLNILGTGLVSRGQLTLPLSLKGVEPGRLSAIAPIDEAIVDGEARLGLNDLLIGRKLAADLGVVVGQPVFVRSEQGRERTLTVRAIYATGVDALDSRLGFVNLETARVLFDLPEGLSEIEIKLRDIYAARTVARQLADATGLQVTAWMDRNQRLREALEGQGSSGSIIKMFTLLTIVIGVASALLLTTLRRRPEIGIMRSFGISERFVLSVFLLQGALIGILGSLLGCALGYGFSSFIAGLRNPVTGGSLPIDPSLGQYQAALLLAAAASIVAALWPARAASRIDPVEAITQ
ncbi:MAG: FtsX-like permease family protein [Steroidobacteraceae bacterium]|nr:FtsX-like permease family protein [Steroidobacteraceae bacterium]MDW8258941.1 FtsX-like permease family protein [Gammaproteobacteria bacterium]